MAGGAFEAKGVVSSPAESEKIAKRAALRQTGRRTAEPVEDLDVVCEEQILNAFAK
jgi:hypothetical protein